VEKTAAEVNAVTALEMGGMAAAEVGEVSAAEVAAGATDLGGLPILRLGN